MRTMVLGLHWLASPGTAGAVDYSLVPRVASKLTKAQAAAGACWESATAGDWSYALEIRALHDYGGEAVGSCASSRCAGPGPNRTMAPPGPRFPSRP
jgi:uncharacterized protein (DUF2342 family)